MRTLKNIHQTRQTWIPSYPHAYVCHVQQKGPNVAEKWVSEEDIRHHNPPQLQIAALM